jgi:hypothetical protein
MAGGDEAWRKNAETHKMSPEDVKAAGVEGSKRPPGHHPGGVLHQRRTFPYRLTAIPPWPLAASLSLLPSDTSSYTSRKNPKPPPETSARWPWEPPNLRTLAQGSRANGSERTRGGFACKNMFILWTLLQAFLFSGMEIGDGQNTYLFHSLDTI